MFGQTFQYVKAIWQVVATHVFLGEAANADAKFGPLRRPQTLHVTNWGAMTPWF